MSPESPFTYMCDLIDPLLYVHIDPSMPYSQGRYSATTSDQGSAEQNTKAVSAGSINTHRTDRPNQVTLYRRSLFYVCDHFKANR